MGGENSITSDALREILAQARGDLLKIAPEALAALRDGTADPARLEGLVHTFHSLKGLLPSLGLGLQGIVAELGEVLTRLVQDGMGQPRVLQAVERALDALLESLGSDLKEPVPASTGSVLFFPHARTGSAQAPIPAAQQGAKILVVDDDAPTARLVRATLSQLGYSVEICTDPQKVMEILEQEPPDILVLDVMMPTVDGFELCRRIRAKGVQDYMPILFLSGVADLERRIEGLAAGGDDYLQKPFDPAEMAVRVRSHLKRVASMKEMAIRDALTRAYNRRYFEERLASELVKRGKSGASMALAMLDIDHFKRINDEYGHPAGDAVLVQTVQALAGEFRASDVLSRYGGEEFALLLLDTGGDAARNTVARACERLAKTSFVLSMPDRPFLSVQVTLSAGVATWLQGEGREGLVGRADRALYAAKRGGRNRVESADGAEP